MRDAVAAWRKHLSALRPCSRRNRHVRPVRFPAGARRRILLGMREESGMNMQSKSEISRIFVLLYFAGIALLVLAFLLLVSPGERTHSAWLDLIVVWIVFSINFPLLSMRSEE